MTIFLITLVLLGLELPCILAAITAECETLLKLLPGKVWSRASERYEESISSCFYVQGRALPACIVAPALPHDISVIVQLLAKSRSPFAIRSGGHASQPGAANVENGITIDLRSLKEVKLYKKGDVVSVGPGALWGDVYDILDKRGLAVLGGRDAHVGVGGLTLGGESRCNKRHQRSHGNNIYLGGISFFSPERGFACDSVTNFQIVLANGTITDANATFNSDLFVALKGGTNNFGIVTRFDIKTFSQGQLWGGAITYPETVFPQLAAAFTETKQPKNFDPYQALETIFVYLGQLQTYLGVASLFYSKPLVNASSLKPFTSIQPQISNSMRLSSTVQLARKVSSLGTPNLYSVWATTTFAITPDIISRIISIWKSTALSMQQVTNITTSMTFQSIPPPPSVLSPNVLGFLPGSTPHKNLVLMLLSTFFEESTAYEQIDMLTKGFFAAVDEVAEDEGGNREYTYLNYAAKWQRPLKDYGMVQWSYLAIKSRKYDPNGVFQRQVGGFKIFA